MAVQAGKNYCVEPLNGNNYYNWKFRIKMILAENNVLEMVESEVKIEEITDEEKKKKHIKNENRAKILIIQFVEDNQLESLRDKSSAYQMWEALEDKYEKKGLVGQLFLKKKLLSLKLKEGDSLDKYIQKFEKIVRQLKCSGAEMKDEDLTCNL